jgi:formylglycine-generating enzyme required for sulfatase activity
MVFRPVPAGRFRMGSRGHYVDEEPCHRVEIPQPFWLGETPVTQAQFAQWTQTPACMKWLAANKDEVEGGKPHQNHFADRQDHPAENLSWHEATAFAEWFTRTIVKPAHPELVASLPAEACWEYACRAGTDTDYHSGDGQASLREAGWFDGDAEGQTHPVRQKRPNDWGLYDMHGNVWEWCADAWDDQAYAKRSDGWQAPLQPLAAEDVARRVFRGGSWDDSAGDCRASFRYGRWPRIRVGHQGFRLLLAPGPVATGGGAAAADARSRRSGANRRMKH